MKISHQFRFNGQYFRSTQGAWLNHKDDEKNFRWKYWLVNLIHATNILPSPQSKTFKNISTTTQTSTLSPWLQDSSFKYETQQPNCRWYGKIHANVFFAPRNRCCCFLIGQFTLWCYHNNSYTTVAGMASGNLWRRNQIWRPSAAVQVKNRELWILFF